MTDKNLELIKSVLSARDENHSDQLNGVLETIFTACAKHDGANIDNIECGIIRLRQASTIGVLRGHDLRTVQEISPKFYELYTIVGAELLK